MATPSDAHPPPAGELPPHEADAAALEPLFVQRHSPVNVALVVVSVLLTLWTNFGKDSVRVLPWFISLESPRSAAWLLEVRHGEIWRLFTPMFLHFSVEHLGFNLLGMISLGNVLERRIGSRRYLLGAFGLAAACNLCEYLVAGERFGGGLSGVLYGLIGYIWLRGQRDFTFGLGLPTQTIFLSMIWLVLCFTGLLGPIANAAHTSGLVVGAIWGVLSGHAAMRQANAAARPANLSAGG